MKYSYFLLTLILFLLFTGGAMAQPKSGKAARAESYMKQGDFLSAIALYDELLKEEPKNDVYLMNRGWSKLNASSFTKGAEDLLAALSLNSSCSRCYIGLAMFSLQNGFLNDALEQANYAIEAEDTASFNYFIRAQIRESRGEDLKAGLDFNKAIELNPLVADYHYGRGMYLFRLGKYEKATEDFSNAVLLSPKVAEYHFQLGYTYYMMRKLDYALIDVKKALQLNATNADYWLGKGAIEEAMGRDDSALVSYTRTVEINPDNALAYYNRAGIYYGRGQLDASCADYAACLRGLEVASFPREDMKTEAMAMLNNHCDTLSPSFYYQRGFVAMELRDYRLAIEAFDAGIVKWPYHPLLQGFRGNALLSLRNYRQAIDAYSMSLRETSEIPEDVINSYTLRSQEVNPTLYMRQMYSSIYDGMAKSYLSLGLMDSALICVDKALFLAEKVPESPLVSLRVLKATVLGASDRDDEAMRILDQVILEAPDFSPAYVIRARLLLKKAIRTGNKRVRFFYRTSEASGMFYMEKPRRFKASKTDAVILQSALTDCKTAILLNPDFAEAYFIRGQIKLYGNLNDYCNDFFQAVTLGIDDAFLLVDTPCQLPEGGE